jgi:hypothetical protein
MARRLIPARDVQKFVVMDGRTDMTGDDKLSTIRNGKYVVSVADLKNTMTHHCTDSQLRLCVHSMILKFYPHSGQILSIAPYWENIISS